jgi:signal transduction histidine kinase
VSTRPDLGRLPEPQSVVRSAVIRFAVFGLIAIVLVGAGTVLVADRIAQQRALDEARTQAVGIADRLAAPLVNADVRAYVPGAADELDTVMTNRMRDGSVRHVKLWDASGFVIWSDQRGLIGHQFSMPDDVTILFGTRLATAEVSDLSREENLNERGEGELLEVYAGTFDADGAPIVFEAYLATSQMDKDARAMATSFVPLFLGSLALFLLVMLPLAVSLARRVERAQLDRSRMMRHALLASDLERRRIAEDLHDGVIQDLAGVGYALPTAARELHDGGDFSRADDTLTRAADVVRDDVAQLRSLMVDIYPPDLEGQRLGEVVHELVVTEVAMAQLEVDVVVEPDLDLPTETGRLVYRVVREGVRNVVKHAHARKVAVSVRREAADILVSVVDDGRGPGPGPAASPKGHLGLQLLRDAIRDFGGSLELRAGSGAGSALIARFPTSLV